MSWNHVLNRKPRVNALRRSCRCRVAGAARPRRWWHCGSAARLAGQWRRSPSGFTRMRATQRLGSSGDACEGCCWTCGRWRPMDGYGKRRAPRHSFEVSLRGVSHSRPQGLENRLSDRRAAPITSHCRRFPTPPTGPAAGLYFLDQRAKEAVTDGPGAADGSTARGPHQPPHASSDTHCPMAPRTR
jgi:hypothetical protein